MVEVEILIMYMYLTDSVFTECIAQFLTFCRNLKHLYEMTIRARSFITFVEIYVILNSQNTFFAEIVSSLKRFCHHIFVEHTLLVVLHFCQNQ